MVDHLLADKPSWYVTSHRVCRKSSFERLYFA